MRKIDPARVERAARIYGSNQEASRALGIAPGSFSRLCRLYDIETPHARQCRRRSDCHRRHLLSRHAGADGAEKEYGFGGSLRLVAAGWAGDR
jgi:hypothetical protein